MLRGVGDERRRGGAPIDALANRAFTGPLLHGAYPSDLLEDTKGVTDWSFVRDGDLELIHQPIDFLGVNYYSTTSVELWDGTSARSASDGHKPAAGSPWPGSGRRGVPVAGRPVHRRWAGTSRRTDSSSSCSTCTRSFPELPLVITENGAAFDDVMIDGALHDAKRVDYLRRHFTAVHRAMQRGVDVRGYLVWSLLDNFEWGYGFSKRFGIVRVDYDTPRAHRQGQRPLVLPRSPAATRSRSEPII